MNLVEIKIFAVTPESKAWAKLNEGELEPLDLYVIKPALIDIDRFVSVTSHTDGRASWLQIDGDTCLTVHMAYDKLRNFILEKLTDKIKA